VASGYSPSRGVDVQRYLAALTFLLLLILVLSRVLMMRRRGIRAVVFGKIDRKDFLIPPFVLFYFYLVLANALGLPTVATLALFHSEIAAWIGIGACLLGLLLFLLSLVSFGKSFRIGVDVEHPDRLVTTGVFALTRNPIYVSFALILLGQLLVFPHWILLVYLAAAVVLFHRQVLREEAYLKGHYGEEYARYCRVVRRYL